MNNSNSTPFYTLGALLRTVRLRLKESLLEASTAVEISGERLALFENGELRPSEDILELLLAHYNVSDKEANTIWEQSGYRKQESAEHMPQMVFLAAMDPRVLYSDMVQVVINNNGVVINFMQTAGNHQPLPVSKIGMSKDHAQSLIDVLQRSLAQANSDTNSIEPKRLSAPEQE